MGYTRYWDRPTVIGTRQFAGFVEDVQAILAHLPPTTDSAGGYYTDAAVVVCGPQGVGKPVITPNLVSFNGNRKITPATRRWCRGGTLKADMSCETFHVPRRNEGEYAPLFLTCKTNRKPYDVAVVACLIALADRCPRVRLQSDGDFDDWRAGMRLFADATGRLAPVIRRHLEGAIT